MKKKLFVIFVVIFFVVEGLAHCEIPCGIYDDELRLKNILENATTIEKSMKKIDGEEIKNQIVRWVMNKEIHATKIQTIVSQYFLTQRIKVGAKDYAKKVSYLHQMLVAAMKCKQTTDVKHVKQLRKLVDEFSHMYLHKHFGAEKH